MKVGDLVYAKHPKMAGMTYLPGIIVKKQKMWYQNNVLMEGIGRSLEDTFEGHWWGIGGHWRALVKKRQKNVQTVTDSTHNENHTKTCTTHENTTFQ